MRTWFFIFVGTLVLAAGCRKPVVPEYEGLRGELMQEAFELLAQGESAPAVKVLERLADLSPDDRFFALALAHERERKMVSELNHRLAAGDLAGAEVSISQRSGFVGSSEAVVQAGLLHRELKGLEAYLQELPFPNSELAEPALERLQARQVQLLQSADYRTWLATQEQLLGELREHERLIASEQLFGTLDLAAAQDDPVAWILLAQWRVLAPDDPRLRVSELLLQQQYRQLADVLAQRDRDAATLAGLELGACLNWGSMPHALKRGLNSAFSNSRSVTLCGLLVRALLHAEFAETEAGLAALRELQDVVVPSPTSASRLLTAGVLRSDQFQAGCWRSPCPSVTDLLQRVRQIRTQPPQPSEEAR